MQTKPIGIFLIGVFIYIGAALLLMAGITLLWPGTFLDSIWIINQDGHKEMQEYRIWIGILFLVLSQVFIISARGWFKRRKWGWVCVVGIFAANAAGDFGRLMGGDIAGGIIGLAIAGFLIYYLTRPKVKELFK